MIHIAIGADHRGFEQKKFILDHLMPDGSYQFIDVGAYSSERTDYPLYAKKVIELMLSGQAQKGILLCGSGIGMSIYANRYKGIYAGVAWNSEVAQQAAQDDNVNILVLPSDYISNEQAVAAVHAWLLAHFKGGRYADRLAMID